MKKTDIYTSSACSCNPGTGGCGFAVVDATGKPVVVKGYGYRKTTNIRMEIMAVVLGIREALALPETGGVKLVVHTPSQIVTGTMNDDFKRKSNTDLWKELDDTVRGRKVDFVKATGSPREDIYLSMAKTQANIHCHPSQAVLTDEGFDRRPAPVKGGTAIVNVLLSGFAAGQRRTLSVTLTSGAEVKVEAVRGRLRCSACTTAEAETVTRLAEQFKPWLSGNKNL